MEEVKNVVVVLTKYQLDMFLKAKKHADLNEIFFIVPKSLSSHLNKIEGVNESYIYDFPKRYISFYRARALIKEAKEIIRVCNLSNNDKFWIANDCNPLVQIINSIVKFKRVYLIEDGIGSYVKHKFMGYDKGTISFLKTLKLLLYFFPYYKSFYNVGGGVKAVYGYSYNSGAYPMQKNIKKVVLAKELERLSIDSLAADNSVVFIGQPLVGMRFLKRLEYLSYIKYVMNGIGDGYDFIYRPHPAELDTTYLEEQGVKVVRSKGESVEDYIFSSGKNISVYSFVSTSLLHVINFENVKKAVAIKTRRMKGVNSYYSILLKSGVEVLEV